MMTISKATTGLQESELKMGQKRMLVEDDSTSSAGVTSPNLSSGNAERLKYQSVGIDLNEFPNEVLALILANLDGQTFLTARQVCRRWRTLTDLIVSTKDRSPLKKHRTVFRSTHNLDCFTKTVKATTSSTLGSPFPNGRVLLLGSKPGEAKADDIFYNFYLHPLWKPVHENFFSSCGRHIQRLVIKNMAISRYIVLSILSFTPSLKHLQIIDCVWIKTTDDSVKRYRTRGQDKCQVITEYQFQRAVANYKSLQTVSQLGYLMEPTPTGSILIPGYKEEDEIWKRIQESIPYAERTSNYSNYYDITFRKFFEEIEKESGKRLIAFPKYFYVTYR